MRSFLNLSAAAVFALAFAGCSTIAGKAPEVTLSGIDIVEIGLLEQRFGLRLRLLNPNDGEIAIEGLTYEVEVNDKPFARGVSDKSVRLPRFGEAVLEVSAVSNLGSLLRQLSELQKGGREAVTYRISGRVHTGGVGAGIPFDHRGEVRLPELPGMPGLPRPAERAI
jgi:LEA14-like dessication related protein